MFPFHCIITYNTLKLHLADIGPDNYLYFSIYLTQPNIRLTVDQDKPNQTPHLSIKFSENQTGSIDQQVVTDSSNYCSLNCINPLPYFKNLIYHRQNPWKDFPNAKMSFC